MGWSIRWDSFLTPLRHVMTIAHLFRPPLFAATTGVSLILAQPALAQHDDHEHHEQDRSQEYHGREAHRPDFHGRDFHTFTPYESERWRGGHWLHAWHDGRYGWWWFVDGGWYFYPQPIYPYPGYVPPVAPAPPPPNGQYWYYCYNPPGYYPYVSACNGPWRPVLPNSQP